MKEKVIKILTRQLDIFCNNRRCAKCPLYVKEQQCLNGILLNEKLKPTDLIKYLYSLDEGIEGFNDD